MIINKVNNAKAVIVGVPNLINIKNIPKLLLNYNSKLSIDYKQKIAYFQISVAEKTGKHQKANFNADSAKLIEYCENNGIDVIGTTNPEFFKFATGSKHYMKSIGTYLDGVNDFKGFKIIPILNFYTLLNRPQFIKELNASVEIFDNVISGKYVKETYGNKLENINCDVVTSVDVAKDKIEWLIGNADEVALDIETTGFLLGKDRIITIAFAPSTEEGFSIPLCEEYSKDYKEFRDLTKHFFDNFKGKQLWYNAMFDIPYILRDIYEIEPDDKRELNKKLNSFDIYDVMHIKYLCVNGLIRQKLSLKDELFDIYGEYDENIDQSRLLDYDYFDVGLYNIYDVTGTFETFKKYYSKMYEEEQDEIFYEYYKPSLITLIKMKYQGLIVNMDRLDEVEEELSELLEKEYDILNSNQYVIDTVEDIKYNQMFKYNTSHKKQKTLGDFDDVVFNPNSTQHKRMLLIDNMDYDILETTGTGNPSLGKDILSQYLENEDDEDRKEVLTALIEIGNASKVKNTFLKAFREQSVMDKSGIYRLHGNYKLHGTTSGRLSSSDPNLQNLPSGSKYGKLVKSIFIAPDGYLFCGADYNALEDRVGAEETRDTAKCKIMLDGYDSHSLNTAVYFEDELKERGLPYGKDISIEDSFTIKEKAPDLRQKSKSVTFALAYGGTHFTVMDSLGVTEDEAKNIVENYHELYSGVVKYYNKWVDDTIANKCIGNTPHGLKIRCPELLSNDDTVAEKARRSYTNALIQGLAGQLTVKALNRIQLRIEEEGLIDDVKLFLTIHDAIYVLVKDDTSIIKKANDLIIGEMIKDYKEDQLVKNKANLDIGYSWDKQEELPNNASEEEIKDILKELK